MKDQAFYHDPRREFGLRSPFSPPARAPRAVARTLALALGITLAGCVGSTGGDAFPFEAYARGSGDAAEGGSFVNAKGYRVTLSRARVLLGAVYLNRSAPTSVSSGTVCTLTGVYVAEVAGPLIVDGLSPEPQAFPALGQAIAERARSGEVWLTGGNVDDPHDTSVILDVAGEAERNGVIEPFEGRVTLGENRLSDTPPEQPGLKPICKERVVSPIPVDVLPARGNDLVLSIDVAKMFSNVDFSTLTPSDDGTLRFDDDPASATAASTNLAIGLRASAGVYGFDFSPPQKDDTR